jgi:hypothetical protein
MGVSDQRHASAAFYRGRAGRQATAAENKPGITVIKPFKDKQKNISG